MHNTLFVHLVFTINDVQAFLLGGGGGIHLDRGGKIANYSTTKTLTSHFVFKVWSPQMDFVVKFQNVTALNLDLMILEIFLKG